MNIIPFVIICYYHYIIYCYIWLPLLLTETEFARRKISKSSSYKQRELDYPSDDEHSTQHPKMVNSIETAGDKENFECFPNGNFLYSHFSFFIFTLLSDFPSKNNCRDLVPHSTVQPSDVRRRADQPRHSLSICGSQKDVQRMNLTTVLCRAL